MLDALKGKKIIVFGSNGYIGNHLVHFMLKYGADIYAYDIDDAPLNPTINYLKIDITDNKSLKEVKWNVDAVFIFAGITGTYSGFEAYKKFITINEIGLLNILTEIRHSGYSPRIIYPSSRLVYKGYDKPLKENDEKEAKSIYAINKLTCEQLLRMYQNVFGLDYTIYRICVPYGNLFNFNYSYGTIGFFLNQAITKSEIILFGDGSLRRSFTHIFDVCNQIALSCFSIKSVNEIYNLLGEEYSLAEISNMIAGKFQAKVRYQQWPEKDEKIESGHTVLDDLKIKSAFGFSLKYRFKSWLQGVKETL